MTCTSDATSLGTNVPSSGAPLPENSYEAAGVSIERGEQSDVSLGQVLRLVDDHSVEARAGAGLGAFKRA